MSLCKLTHTTHTHTHSDSAAACSIEILTHSEEVSTLSSHSKLTLYSCIHTTHESALSEHMQTSSSHITLTYTFVAVSLVAVHSHLC